MMGRCGLTAGEDQAMANVECLEQLWRDPQAVTGKSADEADEQRRA
jgi:hypothetical protein